MSTPTELAKVRSFLIRATRDGAVMVGERFTRPDDDWACVLMGASAGGETHVFELSGEYFTSTRTKDILAHEVLPGLIRKHELVALSLVVSTWTAAVEEDEQYDGRGASEHPDRFDTVMVIGVDRFGDEAYSATINRFPDRPPTLEPWERVSGEYAGRMIDPLRTALRPQG